MIPASATDLAELVDRARRDFFREVGDSANSLILDAATFGSILGGSGEVVVDDRGRQYFKGLEVIFANSPGRKVMLAHAIDPADECESCRGL